MSEADLNKRAVENLIKCGAMDSLGLNRAQLLAIYARVLDSVAERHKRNLSGQMQLFDLLGEQKEAHTGFRVPPMPELDKQELMQMEKETIGLYLSGHPMDEYRKQLRGTKVVPIGSVLLSFEQDDGRYHDEQTVQLAGIIEQVKMKTTRSNSVMAYITLEDDTGDMELLAFSTSSAAAATFEGKHARRGRGAAVGARRKGAADGRQPSAFTGAGRKAADRRGRAAGAAALSQAALRRRRGRPQDPRHFEYVPRRGAGGALLRRLRPQRGTGCSLRGDMLDELRTLLGQDAVVLK